MVIDGQIMTEPGAVDPVSGNEIPAGAAPEQVRDDIPAQLSEGEFVIPAFAVNFYGPEVFESMIMNAQKATGNPVVGTPKTPEVVEEPPMMAEGGEVPKFDPNSFYTGIGNPTFGTINPVSNNRFSQKIYVNDAGRRIVISFQGEQPLGTIPPGYYLEGSKPAAVTPATTEGRIEQRQEEDKTDNSAEDAERRQREAEKVWGMSGAELIEASQRAMRTGDLFESGLAKLGTGIAGTIATGLGGIGGLIVGGLAKGIPGLIKDNLDLGVPKSIALAEVAKARGDMTTYNTIMGNVATEVGVPVEQVLQDRRAGNWQRQFEIYNQNKPNNIISTIVNPPASTTTATGGSSDYTAGGRDTSDGEVGGSANESTSDAGAAASENTGGDSGSTASPGASGVGSETSGSPQQSSIDAAQEAVDKGTISQETADQLSNEMSTNPGGFDTEKEEWATGPMAKGGLVKRRKRK